MKAAYLAIFAVALVAMSGALLVYADSSDAATDDQITIKFDTGAGSDVESITVDKGTFFASFAYDIATPVRANYEFEGWYIDSDFKHYALYNLQFNKDTTLYAKWHSVNDIYVYFINISEESYEVAYTQEIENNTKAKEPAGLTKAGYKFIGWYIPETDVETGDQIYVEFDFNTKLTEDTYIFAAWEAKSGNFIDSIVDFIIDNDMTVLLLFIGLVLLITFAWCSVPLFGIYGGIALVLAALNYFRVFDMITGMF